MDFPKSEADAPRFNGRKALVCIDGRESPASVVGATRTGWLKLLVYSEEASATGRGHNGGICDVFGGSIRDSHGHWWISEGGSALIAWLSDAQQTPPADRQRTYPHVCPDCGSPAYVGFTRVECSAAKCRRH